MISIGYYFYSDRSLTDRPLTESNPTKISDSTLNNTAKINFILDSGKLVSDDWKSNGLTVYFNQLLSFSDNALPINFIQNSEQNSNQNNNKRLGVDNIIVVRQSDNILFLTYKENDIIRSQFETTLDDLSQAVLNINNWICQNTLIENELCEKNFKPLTHDDSFVIENYIRGNNALSNLQAQKAKKFFEICLQQDENFILSRVALALSLFQLSDYNSSIAQALSVIETTHNPLIKSQAQLILGKSYYRLSKLKQAEEVFNQIIKLQVNPIPKGLALLELTKVDVDNLKFDTALDNANQALKIFQQLNLFGEMASSHEKISRIKLTEGKLNEAQNHLTQSMLIYESINDTVGIHNVSTLLGKLNKRMGHFLTAYEYAKQSMDMAKKINHPINIINAHSQISFTLVELGRLEQAQQHAQSMTRLALKENEISALYAAYTLQAEIANSMDNFELALDKEKQALTIAKELKQVKKQIETLCFMGNIAIDSELYPLASQYLDECHHLAVAHDYVLFKAVSQLTLATLNTVTGENKKTLVFLEKSLEYAKQLDHDKLYNEIYMEYYYLNIDTDIKAAEKYLEKIPQSYKQNYPYLMSSAKIHFKQQHYPNPDIGIKFSAKSWISGWI